MSPEQALGQNTDARSDLFSFGAVMYEMATGRSVFSGETTAAIFDSILRRTPPPPYHLNPQVPRTLNEIIIRTLEKDRKLRYQTASDLKADLQRAKRDSSTAQAIVTDWKPERAGTWRGKRVVAALIALALVLFMILRSSRYFVGSSGEAIDSVAVLPFVNMSGNPDTDYLSAGITESLIDGLSELPNLRVISHSGVFRYKGKTTDASTAGRELGVRAVLTGRITQRGDSLSVGTELVKVSDNTTLWGEQYNSKLTDALAVQNDIAARIVEKLRLKLNNEQKGSPRQTADSESRSLSTLSEGPLLHRDVHDRRDGEGPRLLPPAIALDPNYALAYAGIAYYSNIVTDLLIAPSDVIPKGKEAARKAIELDDALIEAHNELGFMYQDYDFDWAAAESEFRKVLDLNPNYAPVHEYYAWYLLSIGRVDEGLREIRRAEQLDPLSQEIVSLAGWFLYFAHHYDESVTELRRGLDLDRNYWLAYYCLAQVYQQHCRFPDAIAALEAARKIDDQLAWPLAELAHAYAMSGRQTKHAKY